MQSAKRKLKRKLRIRKKIQGTSKKPRLSVFRSNNYMYAQLIDDEHGKTLLAVVEKHTTKDSKEKVSKIERAKMIGLTLAKQALAKKIRTVIFDKGSYAYHGRVMAVAKGAREGGLEF